MLNDNNILGVLPFYSDKKYQDRYRYYGYGYVFPLISQSDKLLPFQIITPNYVLPTVVKKIVKIGADGTETESAITFTASGSTITANYAIYHYNGGAIGTPLTEGRYYLKITIEGITYYSEVFTVVGSDMSNYLKLEWWDTDTMLFDGGAIWYNSDNYKNTLYLPTTVGKPTYQFEEEGEERNGYFFAEKQISKKQYAFQFLAPEYLCDALRFLRMHENIQVTENGIVYPINQIETNVEWQEQGNLASVTATFQCATVAKVIGRNNVILTGGDYNDDYNDDYNNQ